MLAWKGVGNESLWVGAWWQVVFGTLLGPGTTTSRSFFPFGEGVRVVFVSGFPAHDRPPGGTGSGAFPSGGVPGLVFGGGCVAGLLFENYIVNASIFIKKQFLLG